MLLAAVEKFWANPAVLLIFSSAGLAATAPAAYLFFRALLPAGRPESQWLAVGLSLPIPFWAAIQEAARDFFHPENMALALALFAAWAGIRGHRVAMWILCVLVLACLFGQIRKWTILRFQVLNAVVNFTTIEFVQASNQSFDEIELVIRSEFSNKQFADALRSWNIAANEEFVLLVEAMLLPEIDFFTGQIN